jgi:hypothetical protein
MISFTISYCPPAIIRVITSRTWVRYVAHIGHRIGGCRDLVGKSEERLLEDLGVGGRIMYLWTYKDAGL